MLSAAMLTETEGLNRCHYTLDLTRGGTTIKVAKAAVASESAGLYVPDVVSFGARVLSTGFPSLGADRPTWSVTVRDPTRTIQNLLGGRGAGGRFRNGTATITRRSVFVDAADHYTVVDGVVLDYRAKLDEQEYEIVIGPVGAFQGELKIPTLSADDWTQIPEENRDLPGQMVFGQHESPPGGDARGMVPTFLVDEDAQEWFVSFGCILTLDAVYNGDTELTLGDWTLSHVNRNGRPYSIITNAGSALTVDDEIKIDCTGVDRAGDGTGALEDRPGHALEIVANNLILNEWPADAPLGQETAAGDRLYLWLSTSGEPIDTDAIDDIDDYFVRNEQEFGAVLTSETSATQFLSDWIANFREPVYWNSEQKLAARAFDYGIMDVDSAERLLRVKRDILGASLTTLGDEEKTEVLVNWLLDHASGAFLSSELVQAPVADETIRETIEMGMGRAYS